MARLGSREDVDDVLSHPFFAEINIPKLQEKTLAAPFIPKVVDFEKIK